MVFVIGRLEAIAVKIVDEDRLSLVVLDLILLHVVFLVGLISTLTLILGLLFLALPLLASLAAVVRLLPLRLIAVLIRVLFILTKIILPILLVDWLHIHWVRPFSLLATLL